MSAPQTKGFRKDEKRTKYPCPLCTGVMTSKKGKMCKDCKNSRQRGENTYNYKGGKPKCLDCGELTTQYNTKRCRKCFVSRMKIRGEGALHWKGGVTPVVTKVRNSVKMREWVLSVFERDNFTCQKCTKRGGDLEAHHIKPFREILKEINDGFKGGDIYDVIMDGQDMWDLENGITLCFPCHCEVDCHRKRFTNLILTK